MGGPTHIGGLKYTEFDNFYIYPFKVYGEIYPTVEHAFQASKSGDEDYRKYILKVSAHEAWRLGQKVVLRPDWEDIKSGIMKELVGMKLIQNLDLAKLLISTFGPIEFKNSTEYWNKENAKILEYARNFLFTHRERLGLDR